MVKLEILIEKIIKRIDIEKERTLEIKEEKGLVIEIVDQEVGLIQEITEEENLEIGVDDD